MPAHPKLTPRRIVALLLALFLLLRLAQALTSTHSYDDEEGYTLTAAFELINHDVWPYQAYQLSDWENGSRVVVWVAAALTWLLGPCLLVLKLTGIIFSCALLAALYLVASAVAGPRAGLLAGLLYIFFPEPVFHYSMTAHGFHTDSVFLQLLFLWRLVRALQGARRIRDLLLCGLLGGLAVWFAYISVSLVLAGSVLLLWRVLRDREQTARRRVAAYVAAGAVGAVLLVAYNMDNGWAGQKIYDAHSVATYVAPTDLGKKLVHFGRTTVPVMAHFANFRHKQDLGGTVFSLVYWVVAFAALIWPLIARRRRRGRDADPVKPGGHGDLAAVVGGTLLVTLFLFLSSKHPAEPWHLVPFLRPWPAWWTACGAAPALSRGWLPAAWWPWSWPWAFPSTWRRFTRRAWACPSRWTAATTRSSITACGSSTPGRSPSSMCPCAPAGRSSPWSLSTPPSGTPTTPTASWETTSTGPW